MLSVSPLSSYSSTWTTLSATSSSSPTPTPPSPSDSPLTYAQIISLLDCFLPSVTDLLTQANTLTPHLSGPELAALHIFSTRISRMNRGSGDDYRNWAFWTSATWEDAWVVEVVVGFRGKRRMGWGGADAGMMIGVLEGIEQRVTEWSQIYSWSPGL
jgi:hypothetical protein